jgi:hypothetical protein
VPEEARELLRFVAFRRVSFMLVLVSVVLRVYGVSDEFAAHAGMSSLFAARVAPA